MTRLLVYVDLDGTPRQVGESYLSLRRSRLTGSFSYDRDYLGLRGAYAIDPSLSMTGGNLALPRGLPGAFHDASPDRWGRNLIAKRMRTEAAEEGRPAPTLDDRDYLLGVSDETRQGALRFTTQAGGEFQHPSLDVPKLVALPSLLHSARAVSRGGADSMQAIKVLLDAGTASLGGARPKASVRDGDTLMIAKFPHHSDEWNVIAWEKVALDLAESAGISTPHTRLVDIDGHSVLLLDRFDRDSQGRVGYQSAMTLLGSEDGETRDYLEIAEAIPEVSSRASLDLRELWRRIAFSIAINNTDDHLRNHGLLRGKGGWHLAPAFDLNPNPDRRAQRSTTIAGAAGPKREIEALLSAVDYFDLTNASAKAILREVVGAASGWSNAARRAGVNSEEIARFEPTLNDCIALVSAHS